MRRIRAVALVISGFSGALSIAASGQAAPLVRTTLDAGPSIERVQVGPGGAINPGRDCQTIRRCQFTRGGSFRGCISAYACRTCVPVASGCTISGRERVCREFQCSWGG
jgi:hypothetical protein